MLQEKSNLFFYNKNNRRDFMKYYIGADLGTSALKLLLVNNCGEIVKTVTRSYPVEYPNAGWSEQNPKDWFMKKIK